MPIRDFPTKGLDRESIKSFSNPPSGEPLFPSLRHLEFHYTDEDSPMLLPPLPSLISLDVRLRSPRVLVDSSGSFSNISLDLRTLTIRSLNCAGINKSRVDPSFISRWRNLRTFTCPNISLDMEALVCLSRLPALTQLSLKLSNTPLDPIPPSELPLLFSTLDTLELHSLSLASISRLLLHIRTPAITTFSAFFDRHPSKLDVSSIFAGLHTCNIGHTIRNLCVIENWIVDCLYKPQAWSILGLEDLQPCMAFSNLRCIVLRMGLNVNLTDGELQTLVSACHLLKDLRINEEWGWNTLEGITPNGLLQVFQTCPSLYQIAVAIDTRGYTEFTPSPASLLGLTFPKIMDVVDSCIEAESVPAIANFFAAVVPYSRFLYSDVKCRGLRGFEHRGEHRTR